MSRNDSIWVSYETRKNSKTKWLKNKIPKIKISHDFYDDKVVKSKICRTYKKNYLKQFNLQL
jgi:hypothetical protein